MMSTITQPDLQARTLRLFGELVCRRERWGGRLAFAAFDGAAASGLAAASSLAGGVSLVVDADGAGMKAHFRDGAFDFVVNTLDEALRAIKNEVRQAKPIAIGLIAEPNAVIAEALERGLAADVVLLGLEKDTARLVAAKDAVLLRSQPSEALTQWLGAKRWRERELSSKVLDEAVTDTVRQRWMSGLPAHQRSIRLGARLMWMSEADSL